MKANKKTLKELWEAHNKSKPPMKFVCRDKYYDIFFLTSNDDYYYLKKKNKKLWQLVFSDGDDYYTLGSWLTEDEAKEIAESNNPLIIECEE